MGVVHSREAASCWVPDEPAMPTMYWPGEHAVVVVRPPLGTCSNVVHLMSRMRQLFMRPGIACSLGTRVHATAEQRADPNMWCQRRALPQQAPADLGVSCGEGADAIPQGREAREDGV